MQFSISSLLALTLTLSLASAAPAVSMSKRDCSVGSIDVQFEGADAPSAFDVSVCLDDGVTPVAHDFLSISHITYDREKFYCRFTAQFDNSQSAAVAAYACSGDVCDVGPPQPVYTVACGNCASPYCDGYSV